jgi:hypothetical protein
MNSVQTYLPVTAPVTGYERGTHWQRQRQRRMPETGGDLYPCWDTARQ